MPIIFLLFSLFFSSESTFTSKSVHGITKETTKKVETPADGREYVIVDDTMP